MQAAQQLGPTGAPLMGGAGGKAGGVFLQPLLSEPN